MNSDMNSNNLGQATSPYLLQHKDNPVHWQPWGQEALDFATKENKPLLLSVGYAACHWCHVMAHESFENDDIADLMNRYFVNIKVDREERPDIDAIYMAALSLTGQQGGWPMTMFLLPDGQPFWGGTYFPPEPRWGRPGFPEVLERIHQLFNTDQSALLQNATALSDSFIKLATNDLAGELPDDFILPLVSAILPAVDQKNGGLTGAPKFPQPPVFSLLWRAFQKSGNDAYREAVCTTLDNMSAGGIYDHFGGGYSRYSVDEQWLAPHFEKMLYDNAQILSLLVDAWLTSGKALYARRIEETVDWLLREMLAEGNAFAATLDADSEGVEGKFYIWTPEEVAASLGLEAERFCAAYDIDEAGNWEEKSIPNRLHILHNLIPDTEQEDWLRPRREILLAARAKRIAPDRDDKILADWNGLMIASLARAGIIFSKPAWTEAAKTAFDAVVKFMDKDGRLAHAFRDGKTSADGLLEDYAAMSQAALALYEISGEVTYLDHAKHWVDHLNSHFHDNERGGFFQSSDDAEALITRMRNATDNATPSGNGMIADVLARLYYLTGDNKYRDRSEQTVKAFAGGYDKNGINLCTLLNGYDLLINAVHVVIIGKPGVPATDAMVHTALSHPAANKILQIFDPSDPRAQDYPDHDTGAGTNAGKATAYMCTGFTCSPPTNSPQGLAEMLPQIGIN